MSRVQSELLERSEAFVTFGAVLLLHDGIKSQSMHAHRPFELIAAVDGVFRLKTSDGAIREMRAAFLSPLERHSILAYEGRLARVYVDPCKRRIRTLATAAWIPPDIISRELIPRIEAFFRSPRSSADAANLIDFWQSIFMSELESEPLCDKRVVDALRLLDDLPVPTADRVTLSKLVGLSPSRFAAIFSADTGMPLRRYIMWRRILVAARLIREKKSVTEAAMIAGFSDNAHLTRTYRATFGVAPSELQTIKILQPTSKRRRAESEI